MFAKKLVAMTLTYILTSPVLRPRETRHLLSKLQRPGKESNRKYLLKVYSMHDYDPEMPLNFFSEDLFSKIFGAMPPDPSALACYACWSCFAQQLACMTTHHPKFSIYIALQLVGLITKNCFLWPCSPWWVEHIHIYSTCRPQAQGTIVHHAWIFKATM